MRRQRWPLGLTKTAVPLCRYIYTSIGDSLVEGKISAILYVVREFTRYPKAKTWNNYFSLMAARFQFNH